MLTSEKMANNGTIIVMICFLVMGGVPTKLSTGVDEVNKIARISKCSNSGSRVVWTLD